MVVALAALVAHPRLDLAVLHGEDQLDKPVHSVAVSELLDPTGYLMGSELVLTTGMWLPSDIAAIDEYVERVARSGAVGLGFGTGVIADETPAPLVTAARKAGLTLIEVGEATPFVAVVRALSDLLVQEERAELLHVHRAHQELSRSARTRGPGGVVKTLSTQVAGEVILMDGNGRIREWSNPSSTELLPRVEREVARLREAGHAGTSLVEKECHVAIQALGSGRSQRGYLVVSTDAAQTKLQRDLMGGAAAILSFGLDQESPNQGRRARQVALIRLVKTGSAPAPSELAVLTSGLLTGSSIYVMAAAGPATRQRSWCRRLQDLGEERAIAGILGSFAYGVVTSDRDLEETLAEGGDGLTVGVSRPTELALLRTAFDEAEQSCLVATSRGARSVSYSEMTSGVLTVADPRAARSFAEELLAPLEAHHAKTGVDLKETLRAWLDHHGHFDPAATALGLHRHTLRHRVNRASELLDRDFDDAETRVDLWFALRISRATPSPGAPRPGGDEATP